MVTIPTAASDLCFYVLLRKCISVCCEMQEELRLAHVAVTRARDRLYITAHRVNEGEAEPPSPTNIRIVQRGPTVGPIWMKPSSFPLPQEESTLVKHVHGPCSTEGWLRHNFRRDGQVSINPELNCANGDGEQSD
jgi:hypothetical protein